MAIALGVGITLMMVFAFAHRGDDLARIRISSVLSLLVILAVTGPPDSGFAWNFSDGLGSCFVFDTSPGTNWLYDGLPNAVLYLPAGLLLASLFRSPRLAIVGLACLAVMIEIYQGLLTDRACQVSDVTANLVGAVLGASLAGAAARLGQRRASF
jgi:VanZ family protein